MTAHSPRLVPRYPVAGRELTRPQIVAILRIARAGDLGAPLGGAGACGVERIAMRSLEELGLTVRRPVRRITRAVLTPAGEPVGGAVLKMHCTRPSCESLRGPGGDLCTTHENIMAEGAA